MAVKNLGGKVGVLSYHVVDCGSGFRQGRYEESQKQFCHLERSLSIFFPIQVTKDN